MFGRFLKEEKAQGAIEYILLAGGIIVAAVIIFALYTKMTKKAGASAELKFWCSELNQTECQDTSGNISTTIAGTTYDSTDCTWDTAYEVCVPA